jgi:hypothetical protein
MCVINLHFKEKHEENVIPFVNSGLLNESIINECSSTADRGALEQYY